MFSFTTDPMLPETLYLTLKATEKALVYDIPVKILTKRADWLYNTHFKFLIEENRLWKDKRHLVAFGFTLTGCDDKELGASSNHDRIEAMRKLHKLGFKTFASIEPVIDPMKSLQMIHQTLGYCDLYKVGLISGKCKGIYEDLHLRVFWGNLIDLTEDGFKIYPKDSLLNYLDEERSSLEGHFVNADYNIFNS